MSSAEIGSDPLRFSSCETCEADVAVYFFCEMQEAAAVGMPVVRHLFLHYPEDQHVQSLVYQQFLVGTELLVVPVLDKGHTQVQAYFPPSGDVWEHVWTGDLYEAPTTQQGGLHVEVQAPLGFPAVFVKRGSWVGQQFMRNLVKENIKMSWLDTTTT